MVEEQNKNKKMSKEDADHLLFWLEKIEKGLADLDLEMKIYRRELQDELDKTKLKNTLQKIINIKDQ
ncbi:MAG TPA: hypothetical protein PK831_00175 [Candidatus Magasanikbacteria bacterium]|jgi:hypothetical protein|nr:hypothetical protein [Candidatus Magasanikbacteria bacterium]HQF56911.1 hypothetical protein [Candidatus Magasanikbacteria bacterium]HQL52805.1 hypothetical protein [Candidatus Magasanikbacteria bacterium]